jgi:SAM-dependent methyltransferase
MEENQYLIEYYSRYVEDGRLSTRHGMVEFLTTMRYIEKYIKPCDHVLEIGAGTGRYSHALARSGYTVDAVELVQHNIDIFNEKTQLGERVTITQSNAMDLSVSTDEKYDVTLLLGPMYHLYTKEDKQTAINEAIRVTKRGGILFVGYCISDAAIIEGGFARKRFDLFEKIEKGSLHPETFATHSEPSDVFELVRKEDIDELMYDFKVSRLHYVATDGISRYISEALSDMDDKTFDLFLKYHFAICERTDMIGHTSHSLDVFRKD